MKITGIICEFNPLHNGHAYLLRQAQETVVCVMSGNSTQRGEFAVTDKYSRAEAALKCGADLVLELPFPWCSGSARYFARTGVQILDAVGADTLLFGSECGDIEKLTQAAECVCGREFEEKYSQACGSFGRNTAAYLNTLFSLCGFSAKSNDILGIEYIRELINSHSKIRPHTVARKGTDYRSSELTDGELPSATALRTRISSPQNAAYMPKASYDILRREIELGNAPADMERIGDAILAFFRLHEPKYFTDNEIAETGAGIANLLCRAARESRSFSEMLERAATKSYTNSRIRRTLLYCMTGVRYADLDESPAYVNLLAANSAGRELLGALRSRKDIPIKILTKPSDCDSLSGRAKRQAELAYKLEALYTLSMENHRTAGDVLRHSPFIESELG